MGTIQKRRLISQVCLGYSNALWTLAHNYTVDLREQHEVRLEQGLDAFVVIDGLPVVPEESKSKLVKFLLKKLNTVGKTKEDAIFMPLSESNMTEGYARSL